MSTSAPAPTYEASREFYRSALSDLCDALLGNSADIFIYDEAPEQYTDAPRKG